MPTSNQASVKAESVRLLVSSLRQVPGIELLRIVMRVGKFAEHFQAALKASSIPDNILRLTAIGRQLGYGLYLVHDSLVWVRYSFLLYLAADLLIRRTGAQRKSQGLREGDLQKDQRPSEQAVDDRYRCACSLTYVWSAGMIPPQPSPSSPAFTRPEVCKSGKQTPSEPAPHQRRKQNAKPSSDRCRRALIVHGYVVKAVGLTLRTGKRRPFELSSFRTRSTFSSLLRRWATSVSTTACSASPGASTHLALTVPHR